MSYFEIGGDEHNGHCIATKCKILFMSDELWLKDENNDILASYFSTTSLTTIWCNFTYEVTNVR